MKQSIRILLAAVLAGAFLPTVHGVDDNEGSRLRESLRASMLQLRSAQTELANAQAAQAAANEEKKALSEQVALLKKHAAEDQAVAEKKAADQKAKLAEQGETIAHLNQVVDELRSVSEKASVEGKASEEKRLQLYKRSVLLERQLADLRAKNVALYRLGKDILTRYEKVGLGQQFMAREPFVGRTRTALENLIQDYDDKLAEQRAGIPQANAAGM